MQSLKFLVPHCFILMIITVCWPAVKISTNIRHNYNINYYALARNVILLQVIILIEGQPFLVCVCCMILQFTTLVLICYVSRTFDQNHVCVQKSNCLIHQASSCTCTFFPPRSWHDSLLLLSLDTNWCLAGAVVREIIVLVHVCTC